MSSPGPVLLPTLLLAVLVLWSGTFHGAASAPGALISQLAVLLFSMLAPSLADPLGLGERGRWLPPVFLVCVVASCWLSPVSRAGWVGSVMLPAYLLLPLATAFCWRRAQNHRWGSSSLALLTLVVCGTALAQWQVWSLPRPSLPLGHHNLLAGWLILVWPLSLVGAKDQGLPRWLAVTAGAGALLTIVVTGSFLGAAALVLQLVVVALWTRRRLLTFGLTVLGVGVFQLPRLLAILRSGDPSTVARLSYLAAGWQGLSQRPLSGWGPGSTPWTLGEFMRPEAGVHPASQVIGDLHSLPVQLVYEIGIVGALPLLGIMAIFARRRFQEVRQPQAPSSQKAALLGLLGGVVFALGWAPLAVPAIMATFAVVMGVSLPATQSESHRGRRLVKVAYLALAMLILLPLNRAHRQYDQARQATDRVETLQHLGRASDLDPSFPLYLARRTWLQSKVYALDEATAELSIQAARMAPGLAPLWLAAGDLGRQKGLAWAPEALAQAHRLDPLSPLPAFHLMTVQAGPEEAVRLGEMAVATEPRLAAARWWEDHPEVAQRVGRRLGTQLPAALPEASDEPVVLAMTLDRTPSSSFSLFAFRRSPWPGSIAPVPLVEKGSATPNTSRSDPPSEIQ